MPTLKIPGVYVQEIPTLPPGVAEVNSAIPAFVGFTETTKFNEIELLNVPTKIQSMLEFAQIYGGSSPFKINNISSNLTTTEIKATVENEFFLYDSLQLYFLNGGGPCYIVSVGTYQDEPTSDLFKKGLDALDLYDEPTLYLFPDAVKLDVSQLAAVQQYALKKCSELMDRFSILDIHKNTNASDKLETVKLFRDNIGMANLNYGAAYTPWLKTSLNKKITSSSITGIFGVLNGLSPSILTKNVNGTTVKSKVDAYEKLLGTLHLLKNNNDISAIVQNFRTLIENYTTGDNPFGPNEIFEPILSFDASDSSELEDYLKDHVKKLIEDWETDFGNIGGSEDDEKEFLITVLNDPKFLVFHNVYNAVLAEFKTVIDVYETFLKENIAYYAVLLRILNKKLTDLPPSGAMAGLYCKTDNDRGVWKAPANISISSVSGVAELYSNADLGNLNVDPLAGKSVNAIRIITGKGTMVMGARTLTGNDSEWRYVPVRRLFIFIEENLRKATEWAVFEPNDKLLWLKIRTQIENYLFELWRRGALAGAKPEDAYQVNCGLNSTMTPQDVLEGKLIIEIKLAAVRPAEFILLKFSHQLQKS